MMNHVHTYERFVATITEMRKAGLKITVINIMRRMGAGDASRICAFLNRFLEEGGKA